MEHCVEQSRTLETKDKKTTCTVLMLPHVGGISKSRKFEQAYKFMDARQLVLSCCYATLVAFQIPTASKTKMALHLHGISTPLSSERVTRFSNPRFPPMVRTRNALPARVKAVAERRESLDHSQRVSHNQQKQSQPKRTPEIASTGLWKRFPTARTVQQMMDTMERMMEDPFAHSSAWPLPSEGVRDGYGQGRTPWAIEERETDYKMRFDMPGMTKNDVKVWVEENMLVVNAEKVPNSRDGQENINGSVSEEEEWTAKSYGRYGSRIALPENIEFEKIKAEVKDGVLYITVPKASVGSKIIDIDVQ